MKGRRSIRLKDYDYRSSGAYFVTVATRNKEPIFGTYSNQGIALNEWGRLAEKYWYELPEHFPYVSLDTFIVMPNHVHGIFFINRMATDNEAKSGDPHNYLQGATHAAMESKRQIRFEFVLDLRKTRLLESCFGNVRRNLMS